MHTTQTTCDPCISSTHVLSVDHLCIGARDRAPLNGEAGAGRTPPPALIRAGLPGEFHAFFCVGGQGVMEKTVMLRESRISMQILTQYTVKSTMACSYKKN